MRMICTAAAAAFVLASCSDEVAQPAQAQPPSSALSPGEYELSWTVSELRSTDRSTPATQLAKGTTGSAKGCIGAGNTIDPALFAEAKDVCKQTSSYVRGGRVMMQLSCTRPGATGPVMQSVDGKSTAEQIEGDISTSTYLSGQGDYSMIRTFTGRRVGECAASAGADQ